MPAGSAHDKVQPLSTGAAPGSFTVSPSSGLSAGIASGDQTVQTQPTARALLETAEVTPTPGTATQVRYKQLEGKTMLLKLQAHMPATFPLQHSKGIPPSPCYAFKQLDF